jgi:DNA-binding SARP family transcriptional activator/tetratricopeptide (TPR) repeat protein
MERLYLRLFGAFQLRDEGGRTILLPTKKTKALLSYLAFHGGRPHERARLAALLWEDSNEPQARESLRQALSLLRKALSPHHAYALATRSDTVEIESAALLVDAVEFERRVAGADTAGLHDAVQLYHGTFLEGFDLRAPEFEGWLASVRQQLNEKAVDALNRLLSHHAGAGQVERGIAVATRLIALDPLGEHAHRALMQLYCRQGRHAAALAQYRLCSDVLAKELGIEPEAATKALYREIRGQRSRLYDERAAAARERPAEQEPDERKSPMAGAMAVVPEGLERRQMTILACELSGLDVLSSQVDPEDLQPVLAAFRQTCRDIAANFGGLVHTFPGSSMTVCFGYPHADEHGAEQAVRAALALADAAPQVDVGGAAQICARAGIATSPVVIGGLIDGAGSSPALVGEAPRLAVLLQTAAEPGAVVIAETTRDLIGGLFDYEPLDERVSGALGLPPAWRVTGERRDASRFDALRGAGVATFVGRAAELERLLASWRRVGGSTGRVELIGGDAGIGKSRLARVFQERIAHLPHRWLHYQCSPFHTDSPLYPVIRQIERAAGLAPQDGSDRKLDRLERMLTDAGLGASADLAENVPLFAALLSIPASPRYPPLTLNPAQLRRKTLAALLAAIERLALRQPVVMMVEDAHWADASTLEFLDLLAERIRRLPVLALVTHRPEFEAPWTCLDHVGALSLAGLDDGDIRSIVLEMSGGRPLPPEVVAQIVHKTDGVPLFVEELTRTVLESGAVPVRRPGTAGVPPAPPSSVVREGRDGMRIAIPATLRDSLMARLDRLGRAKEIAQTGAVIGREFSQAVLEAVVPAPAQQLTEHLAWLTEAGLLGTRHAAAERSYVFRHALIQDAAYETIGRSRRQNLHAAVAQALLDRYSDAAESQPEILAHHYTEAGMVAEALDFWLKAGRIAAARSAHKEAIARLEKGLAVLKAASFPVCELRRRELTFLAVLGPVSMAVHGYGGTETQSVFERAFQLIDDQTPALEKLHILCGLWNVRFHRAELADALVLAQQCLDFAQASQIGHNLANCLMGQTLSSMGEFAAAQHHFQRVIDNYRVGTSDPASLLFVNEPVLALSYMAWILRARGYLGESETLAQEAIVLARQGSNAISVAAALVGRMFMALHGAPVPEPIAFADDTIAYCKEHELALYEHWTSFIRGALQFRQGDTVAGIETMRAAMAAAGTKHSRQFRPFQLACVGAACGVLGRSDEALMLLDEGLALAEAGGEKQSLSAIHRLRGEALLRLGQSQKARQALDCALETARRQGALIEELRAAMTAVRHAGESDRPEACAALLSVYSRFEEGHSLPDLRAASKLLSLSPADVSPP